MALFWTQAKMWKCFLCFIMLFGKINEKSRSLNWNRWIYMVIKNVSHNLNLLLCKARHSLNELNFKVYIWIFKSFSFALYEQRIAYLFIKLQKKEFLGLLRKSSICNLVCLKAVLSKSQERFQTKYQKTPLALSITNLRWAKTLTF